ncbi:hypothetical protein [Jiangella asiatica]|uniref:SAF domain-containing protein n=1 Tax=Jiangella asiatica TaxID=2530372 RepID=A0A4R5D7V7_9ACTN|nr:hypothetical protein [Jiangella asiatica]TDE09506.1 hypothetical protein E1269_14425 [Jiangella asiatica]
MRTSLRWAIATGTMAAAGVGAIAAAGGFGAAAPPPVQTAAAGEPVDVGPADLAVRAWTVRDDVATRALEGIDGAQAWLVLAAEVTAATELTTRFPAEALALPADLGLDEPEQVVLLPDLLSGPDLQPGLPSQVLLLWPLPADELPADDTSDELSLDYIRLRLDDSTIDASQVWRADGVAATAAVPRDDAVGDELVEDW